jgi:hypothetical protein
MLSTHEIVCQVTQVYQAVLKEQQGALKQVLPFSFMPAWGGRLQLREGSCSALIFAPPAEILCMCSYT